MNVKKTTTENKIHEMFSLSDSPLSYMKDYGRYVSELVSNLDYGVVEDIVHCFLKTRDSGSSIFFVGNGGSAATASHFAQDLAEVGRKTGKPGFKSIALTSCISSITALANDYGYEGIFTGQMADLFKKDDVLVAISASGNSPNVVRAAELAKRLGGRTIALVGFDGGKLQNICDHVLHVKTRAGEYGPVEDVHMFLDHMITTYLTMKL